MSQREDSKVILYLNPYDICTGALTLIIVFSQWCTGATSSTVSTLDSRQFDVKNIGKWEKILLYGMGESKVMDSFSPSRVKRKGGSQD